MRMHPRKQRNTHGEWIGTLIGSLYLAYRRGYIASRLEPRTSESRPISLPRFFRLDRIILLFTIKPSDKNAAQPTEPSTLRKSSSLYFVQWETTAWMFFMRINVKLVLFVISKLQDIRWRMADKCHISGILEMLGTDLKLSSRGWILLFRCCTTVDGYCLRPLSVSNWW